MATPSAVLEGHHDLLGGVHIGGVRVVKGGERGGWQGVLWLARGRGGARDGREALPVDGHPGTGLVGEGLGLQGVRCTLDGQSVAVTWHL